MRLSLLNLISTPVPVLNSLELRVRVGLSSEDPMGTRYASEPYEAFLSIYSPEGVFLERVPLGGIPSNRRRMFDVSETTQRLVPNGDHLAVVHRIPVSLLDKYPNLDEEIELLSEPDYSFFRSLVEFSYPGGGNGSVIYETPPNFNARPSSNTLTFTNQLVISPETNSYLVLINSSTDPSYARVADFFFGMYCLSGQRAVADSVRVGPFGIQVIDMKQLIPNDVIERETDPEDGLSSFSLIGGSEDAAMLAMIINSAPGLKAVAVEHTHPPQAYLVPQNLSLQRQIKTLAQFHWQSVISGASDGQLSS